MDNKMEGNNDTQTAQCISFENHAEKEDQSSNSNINQQKCQKSKQASTKITNCRARAITSGEESKARWTKEENFFLVRLYSVYGAKWNSIAGFFNDRSEFSVKNHFYYLKKRMTEAEQIKIDQDLKNNREKRCLFLLNKQAASYEEKMDEDAIVDSFFADYMDLNISKKMYGKCEETSQDTNGGNKFHQDRLSMLKRFTEIIEDQLAIKKAKVSEI